MTKTHSAILTTLPLGIVKSAHICRVLKAHNHDKKASYLALGISQRGLDRWLTSDVFLFSEYDGVFQMIPEDQMPAITDTLETVSKWHILRVLKFYGGNKTKAAQSLQISVRALFNKVKNWGKNEGKRDSQ